MKECKCPEEGHFYTCTNGVWSPHKETSKDQGDSAYAPKGWPGNPEPTSTWTAREEEINSLLKLLNDQEILIATILKRQAIGARREAAYKRYITKVKSDHLEACTRQADYLSCAILREIQELEQEVSTLNAK